MIIRSCARRRFRALLLRLEEPAVSEIYLEAMLIPVSRSVGCWMLEFASITVKFRLYRRGSAKQI
jgi:hypothetical protein